MNVETRLARLLNRACSNDCLDNAPPITQEWRSRRECHLAGDGAPTRKRLRPFDVHTGARKRWFLHLAFPTPGPGQAFSLPLEDGDAGTARTIAAIRQYVDAGVKDPAVNHLAVAIVRQVPAHNELAEVRAIYDWVLSNIRFVKDPAGKETLRPARTILEIRAGDCDCINGVLLPALLGTVGYETRLVTVATVPSAPSTFSHVYPEVFVGGQWIPVDAARPGARFGRAPDRVFRKRIWSLVDDRYADVGVRGLAGLGALPSRVVPYRSTISVAGARRSRVVALPRRYARRRLAGLGQDDVPFGESPGDTLAPGSGPLQEILAATPDILSRTAQVIAASRVPSYQIPYLGPSAYPGYPGAAVRAYGGATFSMPGMFSNIPGWVWLVGGAIVLMVGLRK